MESSEIFALFAGKVCPACEGSKQTFNAFCKYCYRELPKALQACLWQKFGQGFEQAFQACMSWFREHPFQGETRAKQQNLF
jgi:hypothetical protein